MTQITTYEQIIEELYIFTQSHAQLNDYGVGPVSDISTKRQMKFPYMWVTHTTPSTITINPNNMGITPYFNFTFIIMDKINIQTGQDENGLRSDNQIYIMSDTHQIGMDLIGYLLQNGLHLDEQDVSFDPIYDETTDKASGWKIDIGIKFPYMNCVIPQKIAPTPN